MVELKKKKIMFKGKNVYYKTLPSLAKKLKISKQEAKQLVEDINSGNTNKYIEKDGNIGRYNISTDKPLFLKDFGVKRLTNKQLLNNQGVSRNRRSNPLSSHLRAADSGRSTKAAPALVIPTSSGGLNSSSMVRGLEDSN